MPNEFTVPDEPEDELPIPVIPVPVIYERQATLGLSSPSVILVGAGGVGCWTALALVLGGIEDITIFDGDTLSENNLNRFPLPATNIGELKSVALAHWLQTLRPRADIKARGQFDGSLHTTQANWVVCCTDSLKSRQMCYKYATQEIGASYLELGADGERWTLSPQPPEFSTELEANAGYQVVPVHVGPCMMAGAAAAYYILHNQVPLVSHSVNWDKGPDIRYRQYAELDFNTVNEVEIPEVTCVTCSRCHRKVEADKIHLIKHLRTDEPTLGLREAKDEAEALLEVEAQFAQVERVVGDWTPEQVASHDEWAATPEGQAVLAAPVGMFNADGENDLYTRVDYREQVPLTANISYEDWVREQFALAQVHEEVAENEQEQP